MTNEEALTYFKHRLDCGQCGEETTQRFAFEEAIKALEKQIPKKLIETEEFVEGSCQNCKRNIDWIKDEYFDFDNCPFCGQAIDWSDEDG